MFGRSLLLLMLCLLMWSPGLLSRDLWSSHEARAAQNAARMLEEGDFARPRLFDDQYDYQKPPMYYWLVAGLGSILGVDALAVRLPAFMAGLVLVLAVHSYLSRQSRPQAGFIAALALACMTHFAWLARVGRIDMPLACCIGLALLCLHEYASSTERRNTSGLLGYLALALAVLLKGPIGLALPAAVLVCWGLLVPAAGWRLLRSLAWGLPLVLAVCSPWYGWANFASGGEFFRVFFGQHHFNRAFGGDGIIPHAGVSYPFWYYWPVLAVETFPLSPLALVAIGWLAFTRTGRGDSLGQFGLVWLLAMLALLSCARFKRADYLLPAYAGLAVLIGCAAEHLPRRRLAWLSGSLVAACVIGWWTWSLVWLPALENQYDRSAVAARIRQAVPRPQLILLFRVEDHALTFRLGRHLNTLREWENLDAWVARGGPYHVLMPADLAEDWPKHIRNGRLIPVVIPVDCPGRKLVLFETSRTGHGVP